MQLKHIESLKSLDDNDLQDIIDSSFSYYMGTASIPNKIREDSNKGKVFSGLIRFYRSFNSNKKFEEEQVLQSLKELLKGKTSVVTSLWEKINNIHMMQIKRIKFGECGIVNIKQPLNLKMSYLDSVIENIKKFANLTWRINICISNNLSNRVSGLF
jgi:hypothetical protein